MDGIGTGRPACSFGVERQVMQALISKDLMTPMFARHYRGHDVPSSTGMHTVSMQERSNDADTQPVAPSVQSREIALP